MKHILVADDEAHIRLICRHHLENAGYRVTEAASGKEALERLVTDRPDLVLLDVEMPGMDGYETFRRLMGNPATEGIPVIMLTWKAADASLWTDDVYPKLVAIGLPPYLVKPFNPQQMLAWIDTILSATW